MTLVRCPFCGTESKLNGHFGECRNCGIFWAGRLRRLNVDTNKVYDRLKRVITERMKEQGKTEQQFEEAWRSLYYTIPVTGFLERMCNLLHALRCTQEDVLYIFEADKLPSGKEGDC